jgi:hypothetical protein
MIFINSHAIDNNRMYVLKLYLLNFLFNGFHTSLLKQKKRPVFDLAGFPFPGYSGEGRDAQNEMRYV